jgi:peptidoglycan/xylan/chitin deacetylase (PgdA/CDA1 family)
MYKAIEIFSRQIPLNLLMRIYRIDTIFPFYHLVSNAIPQHIKNLHYIRNVKDFKSDLDFFLTYFQPLTLETILHCIRENQPLPQKSFYLTFDDGLREIYDIEAPILTSRNLTATFFLNPAFIDNKDLAYVYKLSVIVEWLRKANPIIKNKIKLLLNCSDPDKVLEKKILSLKYNQKKLIDEIAFELGLDFNEYLAKVKPYLSTEEIIELIEQGFTIGGHSMDHPVYTELNDDEKYTQTLESMKYVKENFSLDYNVFAVPFTDATITKDFFEKIFENNMVELSFGASGLITDIHPKIQQRFWMEEADVPVLRKLKYDIIKAIIKTATGKIHRVRKGYGY